jgi:hypothetical protein
MARKTPRPAPTLFTTLLPLTQACPACGSPLLLDYYNNRTVTTPDGVVRLRPGIRRCHHHPCERHRLPVRPDAEGRVGLPYHEFGLDVIALAGALRYARHRSVPGIHQDLGARHVVLARRSVSNLLDRYDELLALATGDRDRLGPLLAEQGRVVPAIDGMQPDVGHEVLWVVRECLSGEVLLAKGLLSSTRNDLAELLHEAGDFLDVPVLSVVSDGQRSIRNAVAKALPGVPHQLCQFHYLREAGTPIYEMDRHAKKELKKTARGIRTIERQVEQANQDPMAEVVQGYCAAVRGALTDDGRPPLDAKGLPLEGRLQQVAASVERVVEKGGRRNN